MTYAYYCHAIASVDYAWDCILQAMTGKILSYKYTKAVKTLEYARRQQCTQVSLESHLKWFKGQTANSRSRSIDTDPQVLSLWINQTAVRVSICVAVVYVQLCSHAGCVQGHADHCRWRYESPLTMDQYCSFVTRICYKWNWCAYPLLHTSLTSTKSGTFIYSV